jgi:cytochrome c oxidase subunit 2
MTFALLIEALGICYNASQHGYVIDNMLEMLHWFMLALFVGWGSFYAYTLWRFRASKHPKADYVGATSHLPTKLEGGVLVLEVVLLMSFAAPIWANRVDDWPTGKNVIHLSAIGQQFLWNFHYSGNDGKFGKRNPALITAANQVGLDRSDPAAADDIVAMNEMHLPINQPCIVEVSSKDVIHDFCIPNMRVAQDAIPGSIIPLWFIPVKEGTYEIVCAQLCGPNHAYMKGTLVVESEEKYKKWYADTLKLSQPAPAPAPAPASPAAPAAPAPAPKAASDTSIAPASSIASNH